MEKMTEITPERMAEIKQSLKDIQVTSANQALIQDNKILFTNNDNAYRCTMPSQEDQNQAEMEQNKLKIKLSQEVDENNNPVHKTQRQWVKILKNIQGIDIKELEKEKDKVRQELQDAMLEEAVILSDEKERLKESAKKKIQIEERFMELAIEIAEALAPCIEKQAEMKYYRYLAYACTEKKIEDDKYEKVWNTFEEYRKDRSSLPHKALDAIQSLLLHVKA